MSYQVLARKWRPRNFETLVGQEHVVKALTNALDQQRLHHAYLFTGTRGVGKTTIARILAKSLNCETGITSKPCGKCSACVEIDAGRFVDLIEVDAATNTKVEEMRQLLENAVYSPTRGRFKVYVIDEVHMLSTSAFNAMLKTLEEPPPHIKFILATTDPQKIPVTVLSRCLQFSLKQMPASAIVEHLGRVLEAEAIKFEVPAIRLIAASARGSMRDALSLMDQAIAFSPGVVTQVEVSSMLGTVDDSYLFDILSSLAAGDAVAALAIADKMEAINIAFDSALQELASLLHRLALAQRAPAAIGDEDIRKPAMLELAAKIAAEDLQLYYQIAVHGRQDLPYAPDPYAGFTMALLRMFAFRPDTGNGAAASPRQQTTAAVRPKAPESGVATPVERKSAAGPAPGAALELTDWPQAVRSLNVTGFARQLAQQSELEGVDGDLIKLRVPASARQMTEKAYQDKLRAGLEEYLGRPVRLQLSVGGSTTNSAQDRAVSAIGQDVFVREMMEQLDATIVNSSIKPAS